MKRRILSLFSGAALLLAFAPAAAAATRTPDVWARAVHHEDGSRTESSRDANARIIESKTFDKEGQMVMKRVFQTDERGVPRRGFVFDRGEKLIYRIAFEYDEIGRTRVTTLSDPDGQLVQKVQHHYNAEGEELAPSVQNFARVAPQPGEIRPSAARAQPGSTEPVLEGAAPAAAAPEEPAKKKKFFQFFKRKK